jgi:hypothetical protein
MDKTIHYEIRVDGQLSEHWSDWFEGLKIHGESDGVTALDGCLPDQAALISILTRIQALNLVLLSVSRYSPER